MAEDAFHEIQLSGKHLVALFMAATVVAVVVFLCGVAVGRGVLVKRTAEAEASAPTDPTADTQSRTAIDPTTTGTTSSEPAAPASQETLSYPDRLANNSAAPETLKPTSEPTPEAERAAPPRTAPAPAAAAPSPAPAAAASADAPADNAGFVVQVAAVREKTEADTIAKRLTSRGYRAFVMTPATGAPRVFRVRVGKFKDRREAEQVAARLEKEEQFKPWITR